MPLVRSRAGVIECAGCGVRGAKKEAVVEKVESGGASAVEKEYYKRLGVSPGDFADSEFETVYDAPAKDYVNDPVMNFGGSASDAALGRMLLEGYTMKGSTCESCGGVLMERGSEGVVCVGCDEGKKVAAAVAAVAEDSESESDDDFEREAREIQMRRAAPVSLTTPKKAQKAVVASAGPALGRSSVLDSALAAVLAKIGVARDDLEQCTDSERVGELAKCIKGLAECVTALKGASK